MKSRTVVIIEDNEQNLYLMRFLLEKNGFVVKEARDGCQGLTLAKEVNPDLILLDIQLPDMDGYAVAQGLRRQDGQRDTPIIVVTSYAMVGDREKALAAGATGYIEKPINPDIFIEQLRVHVPSDGKDVP